MSRGTGNGERGTGHGTRDAGPLAGITVVALEQAVAAPFATRQLADLGARVIKIERPGAGDFARTYDHAVKGLSSHFVWLNRSKESLTLDLKHAEARAIVERLLAQADIFVQNLAPGAVERLGWAPNALAARQPRLIVCSISGYGSSGPYREKKAYDLLIQAEAGVLAVTGTPEAPSRAGISVADIAGGMYAFSGILTALYHRERGGTGAVMEISLFDGLAEWMGFPIYFTRYGGTAPARNGAFHAAIAPYGPYTAGDDKTVLLGIQNEREWVKFCEVVLQQPELARDGRFRTNAERVTHRAALEALIHDVFSRLTVEQVIERLEQAQIANSRMNSVQEFVEHPQLAARERWRTIGSPAGPIQALLPPVVSSEIDYVMDDVPEVGAHTDTILRELGYRDGQIAELRAAGVI